MSGEYKNVINGSGSSDDMIVGEGTKFKRIRRITGYLVGDISRWNNGKLDELSRRVTHS